MYRCSVKGFSRRGTLAAALVLFAGVCLDVSAGQAEGEAPSAALDARRAEAPLDCDAAVTFALVGDPTILAAQSDVLEARAKTGIMRWLKRPELRLRQDANRGDDQTRVGVRWGLPVPGVPGARADAAKARAERSSAEVELLTAQVAATIRRDYAVARHARAQRIVLDRLAERADAHQQIVGDLMTAGVATALAKEAAVLVAEQVREEATQARAREEIANAAVIRWTGQPPRATGSACTPPHLSTGERSAHPDVERARAAAVAAKAEVFAVQREQWLWPSFLEASWVRQPGEEAGVIVRAGVRLPVPNNEAAAARARQQKRGFELEAVERRVLVEIEAATAKFHAARQVVERLEAAADRLTKAQSLASRGHEAGADAGELWRLEQRIADWQQRLNDARYEAEISETELRLALGLP